MKTASIINKMKEKILILVMDAKVVLIIYKKTAKKHAKIFLLLMLRMTAHYMKKMN